MEPRQDLSFGGGVWLQWGKSGYGGGCVPTKHYLMLGQKGRGSKELSGKTLSHLCRGEKGEVVVPAVSPLRKWCPEQE